MRFSSFYLWIIAVFNHNFVVAVERSFGIPKPYEKGVFPPPGPRPAQVSIHVGFTFPAGPGNCSPAQIQTLEVAFVQTLEYAEMLYEFIERQISLTPDAMVDKKVADICWTVFGLWSDEDFRREELKNQQRTGKKKPLAVRSEAEIVEWEYARGILALIASHSQGLTKWYGHPNVPKTRMYCSDEFFSFEEFQRDDKGVFTTVKHPGGPLWVDPITGFAGSYNPCRPFPGKTLSDAFTSVGHNMIVWCKNIWESPVPYDPVLVRARTDNAHEPWQRLEDYKTLSALFLHEYTHLVGWSIFNGDGVVDHAFGWCDIANLKMRYRGKPGENMRTRNADSYPLLAIALYLGKYDCSSGTCNRPVTPP